MMCRPLRAVLLIALALGSAQIAAQDVASDQSGWMGLGITQATPSGALVVSVSERGPAKAAGNPILHDRRPHQSISGITEARQLGFDLQMAEWAEKNLSDLPIYSPILRRSI